MIQFDTVGAPVVADDSTALNMAPPVVDTPVPPEAAAAATELVDRAFAVGFPAASPTVEAAVVETTPDDRVALAGTAGVEAGSAALSDVPRVPPDWELWTVAESELNGEGFGTAAPVADVRVDVSTGSVPGWLNPGTPPPEAVFGCAVSPPLIATAVGLEVEAGGKMARAAGKLAAVDPIPMEKLDASAGAVAEFAGVGKGNDPIEVCEVVDTAGAGAGAD